MPVLDFSEIPEAHIASGMQDTFEFFARDFLRLLGYEVISGPNRGADGGADLVVEEKRTGIGGETRIRWLVSCKHLAHGGRSVSPSDESNVMDRVLANHCQGFIGFYSTLASSGLARSIDGLRSRIECQTYDRERIEDELLHSRRGAKLAERYFPRSMASRKSTKPAEVFSDDPSLQCEVCNKRLLGEGERGEGVITLWYSILTIQAQRKKHYEHIYWTCKRHCDRAMKRRTESNMGGRRGLTDGWEDISDLTMPTVFIKWVMTIFNQLRDGTTYSDDAFDSIKLFLLSVYPYVCRDLTDDESDRIHRLMMLPSFLGGLGPGE